jgi:hypothetical protein
MRRCLTKVVFAVALSLPLPALAQQQSPNCPPGSWFCADVDVQTPPAAPQQPQRPQQPPAAAAEEPVDEPPAAPPPARPQRRAPPPTPVYPDAPAGQPPVVIYQPIPSAPPPNVIIVTPGYRAYRRPVRHAPPPPPKYRPWRSEFGLNLRVEGMMFGKSANKAASAGMGGVGLSLRYRPIPAFAIDAGVDLFVGNDYNGFERTEIPVSLSGMIYLNPRSRVQLYLMGGMHVSRAEVRSADRSPLLYATDTSEWGAKYTYFGGQGGAGLEFRVGRHIGLNIDGLGFYRGRVDGQADVKPEFVDNRGRTTNKSAGGVVRGGLTFWW